MDLKCHLQIRTPVVWVVTDEAVRVIEAVVEHCDRPVFRMDPLQGFCRWSKDEQTWQQVMVGQGPGMAPTSDLNEALPVVADLGGALVIEQAHELPINRVVSGFTERFRRAVLADDATDLPAQLILCSHKEEVDPGVNRILSKSQVSLPTVDELTALTGRLARQSGLEDVEPEILIRAGRAASGLSEAEAITTTLACLAEKKVVDPEFLAKAKLDAIKAGGLLEVRSPKVSLNDVGGMDHAKGIIEAVAWMWEHPKETETFEVVPLRRMLMIGLPGGGKSLMAEATASTLGLDLAKGGVSSAMSKWVGESEANIRKMFKQLKAMAPILFWVDELGRDLSGGASSSETDGGTTDRAHGEFLSGLQELPEDVFLLAAANRIDHLPPEMTRADRFDKILFVGMPTEEERRDIFRIHLGAHAEEYDLDKLAGATSFFTGAEIKALVREVRFTVAAAEHRRASTQDLLAAAPHVKGRAWLRHHSEIIAMYKRAKDEWDWASSAQQEEADEILKAVNPKARFTPAKAWKPDFDDDEVTPE